MVPIAPEFAEGEAMPRYPSSATPTLWTFVAKAVGLNLLSPEANGRPNRFKPSVIVVEKVMTNPGTGRPLPLSICMQCRRTSLSARRSAR